MVQSSLTGWLKKPSATPQADQPPRQSSVAPPPVKRPPPPPKSVSASPRIPTASTPVPPKTENWNDIPDDFLSAPSRPRAKKSPRLSPAPTPGLLSRPTTPVAPPVQTNSIPQLFALRPLPPNVEIAPLTEENLEGYKRLNALTLPIPYPDSFYKETMTEPHRSITLVALWHSSPTQADSSTETERPRLVGAIRCRLLPSAQLYISTIGIQAPYRSHGIAMHLLQAVVKKAVELYDVRSVTAHVWEANEEGLEWYAKRKFEVLGKEEGYYRKLKPGTAVLVRKWIGVGDLLGSEQGIGVF